MNVREALANLAAVVANEDHFVDVEYIAPIIERALDRVLAEV